ncbi:MAG: VF530 family protein [Thiovulaceae bacterium]|nr:VF530 family protein [Sulfurimonadaceae bacterium]
MSDEHKNNPLHGITLKMILEELSHGIGWKKMYEHVEIRCFYNDPTITSSLKFLRKTPWARKKVEELYLQMKKSQD